MASNQVLIPDKTNNFNVYSGTAKKANRLIGVTDEVTLVELNNMSETLSLAGMAGEVDSPAVGQYESMKITINFTNISEKSMDVAAKDDVPLIFRSAQEFINPENNVKSFKQRTTTLRGMTKGINLGRLKKGGYGNPSVTKEVTYYKEEVDGKVVMEIDKFNGKAIVNGVDVTKKILEYI